MEPHTAKTIGSIEATMFFIQDERRNSDPSQYEYIFDCMAELREKHNVPFRDVNAEMLFKAELFHGRYYPIDDFMELCRKCFDFRNIKNELPKWEGDSRQVNRIKKPQFTRRGGNTY